MRPVALLLLAGTLLLAGSWASASTAYAPPLRGTPDWYTFNLLPAGGISLSSDRFQYDDFAECSEKQALSATYRDLALPGAETGEWSLVLPLSKLGSGARGVLMSLADTQVLVDSSAGEVVLMQEGGAQAFATFRFPGAARGVPDTAISLARRPSGALQLCIDGTPAELAQALGGPAALQPEAGWYLLPAFERLSLDAAGVTLGDARGYGIDAQLQTVHVFSKALSCGAPLLLASGAAPLEAQQLQDADHLETLQGGQGAPGGDQAQRRMMQQAQQQPLEAQIASLPLLPNRPPAIANATRTPARQVYVGDPVGLDVVVSDADGDALLVRATFYGVPAERCNVAHCGDLSLARLVSGAPGGGAATVRQLRFAADVAYLRAGRYIIRVEVSDMKGQVVAHDLELLVRKQGDVHGKARCCRHTAQQVAAPDGRPIHAAAFRHASVFTYGAAMGWSQDYLQAEDLESERLFDYGILATLPAASPLEVLACSDARLAGSGSQPVGVGALAGSNSGHNKRLLIVPQGYAWAREAAEGERPVCQRHWSDWPAQSPAKQALGDGAFCSYACTQQGVGQMVEETGAIDRLMEAIVEASYGRLSFAPQPISTDTLWLPRAVAGTNAFSYNEAPLHGHLARHGVGEMAKDYHTVLVLAPLPLHVNPGFQAWTSSNPATPVVFAMRCNPQHGALAHEMGHRLGMAHASVYRPDDGRVPVDPLGPGVMDDSGADPMDVMSSARGQYGLQSRILAGWVPSKERALLPLAAVRAADQPASHDYVLWPYDRPESRGQLKAVTLRIASDKTLVLGYRSAPAWPDVALRHPGSGKEEALAEERGQLAPEGMRANVRGVTVEYSQRYLGPDGNAAWSSAGILDFNAVFGLFPHALPGGSGAPSAAFAALREGYAWVDTTHRIMVTAAKLAPCPAPAQVPVYNYTAAGYLGLQGAAASAGPMAPPTWERADYSGHQSLECMHVSVKTGVAALPGTLDARVRVAGANGKGQLVLGGDGSCAFPLAPRLELSWPGQQAEAAAIVWQDQGNRTFAVGNTTVSLPPASPPLRAWAAPDAPVCGDAAVCGDVYWVKLAAADGAQTLVKIVLERLTVEQLVLHTTYTYFLLDGIKKREERQVVPIVMLQKAGLAAAEARLRGVELVQAGGAPVRLGAAAHVVVGGGDGSAAPDSRCSGQWSVSLGVQLRTGRPPRRWAPLQLFRLLEQGQGASSGAAIAVHLLPSETAGQPGGKGLTAALSLQGITRTLALSLQAAQLSKPMHVVAVRDQRRLGLWVNGQGGWLYDDTSCLPDRNTTTFCAAASTAATPAAAAVIEQLTLAGGASELSGAVVTVARVYNYALPVGSMVEEAVCAAQGDCGRFRVAGYAAPVVARGGGAEDEGSAGAQQQPAPHVQAQPLDSQPAASRAQWQVGPWGDCSLECGGGVSTREVACARLEADGSRASVPSSQCSQDDMPVDEAPCNTVSCPDQAAAVGRPPACTAHCAPSNQSLVAHCVTSLGLLAPLQQCSISGEVAWESVVLLDTARPGRTRPLSALVGSGSLVERCRQENGGCGAPVRWQLSKWQACSSACGGGLQTRSAVCIDAGTLKRAARAECVSAHGEPPAGSLKRACNTQSCNIMRFEVGPWSSCQGAASPLGYMVRAVTCSDGAQALDASDCPGEAPHSTSYCLRSGAAALCRLPGMASGADCSGNGRCGFLGCECSGGHHGQFCEVPPSCPGALTKTGACCATGMVTADGHCCTRGQLLDVRGACCAEDQIDACGTCGGNATVVDINGHCCATQLDQTGTCCQSGHVDECGVCDGDSTTCVVQVYATIEIPESLNAAGWEGWRPGLVGHLAGILSLPAANIDVQAATGRRQAPRASGGLTKSGLLAAARAAHGGPAGGAFAAYQQALAVSAAAAGRGGGGGTLLHDKRAEGAVERVVLAEEDFDLDDYMLHNPDAAIVAKKVARPAGGDDSTSGKEGSQGDKADQGAQPKDAMHMAMSDEARMAALLESTAGGARGSSETLSGEEVQAAAKEVAGRAAAAASGIQPLVAGARMQRLVVTLRHQAPPPWGAVGLEGAAAMGPFEFTVAAVGRLMLGAVVQQVPKGKLAVMLRAVDMVDRMGVCGNGVCEVGEQRYFGSWQQHALGIAAMTSLCPEDCEMAVMMCPAPQQLGTSSLECGGNGLCLRSVGRCNCFDGYTGDDCGQCQAGYAVVSGQCIKQYIGGRTVLQMALQHEALVLAAATGGAAKGGSRPTLTQLGVFLACALALLVLVALVLRMSGGGAADLPTHMSPLGVPMSASQTPVRSHRTTPARYRDGTGMSSPARPASGFASPGATGRGIAPTSLIHRFFPGSSPRQRSTVGSGKSRDPSQIMSTPSKHSPEPRSGTYGYAAPASPYSPPPPQFRPFTSTGTPGSSQARRISATGTHLLSPSPAQYDQNPLQLSPGNPLANGSRAPATGIWPYASPHASPVGLGQAKHVNGPRPPASMPTAAPAARMETVSPTKTA